MIVHHDSTRTYEEGVSDVARRMKIRLHENIQKAQAKSVLALERIEAEVPNDMIVPAKEVQFEEKNNRVVALYPIAGAGRKEAIHPWALTQMCEAAGFPKSYLNAIIKRGNTADPWGAELAAENLEKLFQHNEGKHLVRSYHDETRGFLSPRYQRRHPGKLLDVLIQGFRKHGLIAHEAWCSDTKHGVRAMLDRIFEPVPNECLGIGLYYAESPYGNGATELSISVERMWCSNLAISEQPVRSIHMGSNLSDDVVWSEATYNKDTELACSKLLDLMDATVSENALKKLGDGVRAAHEKGLKASTFDAFLKKYCSKEEAEGISDVYRSNEVEMLPPGNTVWRASNAISFFAGKHEGDEKKFDLQKLAGKALTALAVA